MIQNISLCGIAVTGLGSKGENHSWPEMFRLAAAETVLGCAGGGRVVVGGHLWLAAHGRRGSCVVLGGSAPG